MDPGTSVQHYRDHKKVRPGNFLGAYPLHIIVCRLSGWLMRRPKCRMCRSGYYPSKLPVSIPMGQKASVV
jgi:hypothetical protein